MKLKLCLLAIVFGISIFALIEIFQGNNTKQDKIILKHHSFSKTKTSQKLIIDQTLQSSYNKRTADFSKKKFAPIHYLTKAETNKLIIPIHLKNTDGINIENAEIELILYNEISEKSKTDENGTANLKIDCMELLPIKITHKDYATKIVLLDIVSLFPIISPYEIVLEKGRELAGFACDTKGNLLENIDINLMANDFGIVTEIDSKKTDEFGKFNFTNVGFEVLYFKGTTDDLLLQNTSSITNQPQNNIKLVFDKGERYEIRVVNEKGEGISNANVIISYCEFTTDNFVNTDENGLCSFVTPKTGKCWVKVTHPDFATYESNEPLYLKLKLPNEIILLKGKTLSGKITESITSQPIKKALVSCSINNRYFNTCLTDEDGYYHFVGLENGALQLEVTHSDFKKILIGVLISNNTYDNQKNFMMNRKNLFQVKLVNKINKLPLSNQTIKVIDERHHFKAYVTNEKGEFAVYLPDSILQKYGEYPEIRVEGFSSFYSSFVTDTNKLIWEVSPSTLLRCKITDMQGLNVEGVSFYENENSNIKIATTYDILSGSYLTKVLPEGINQIFVEKPGFLKTKFTVNLITGEEKLIKVDLEKAYRLIFKLDFQDNPQNLSALQGQVFFNNTESYQAGQSNLIYFADKNTFEVEIENQDWATFSINFPQYLPISHINIQKPKDGFSTYNFSLVKGLGISGKIVDEAGIPIQNATITFNLNTAEYSRYKDIDICYGKEGQFSIFGLVGGKYTIGITHHDYLNKELNLVINSQPKNDLTIELKKGAIFSGIVSNSKGEKIVNTDIRLYIDSTNNNVSTFLGNFFTTTDSNGKFELHKISSGKYQVSIQCATNYAYSLPIELSSNTTTQNIILKDYLNISGQIVDRNNKPIKNIQVYARDGSCGHHETNSDEYGDFIIQQLTEGQYSISTYSREYINGLPLIANTGDSQIKITLDREPPKLAAEPVAINGRVITPDGSPIGNFSIEVDPEYGRVENLEIKEGAYQFTFHPSQNDKIKIVAKAKEYNLGLSKETSLTGLTELALDIILNQKQTIELEILDKYTQQPITNASIELIYLALENEESKPAIKIGLNNKDGIVTIDNAFPGAYLILVKAKGFIKSTTKEEIFNKFIRKQILLDKGGSLKGQLLNWGHKPLPFVPVFGINTERYKYLDRAEYLITTISDENGYYEFTNVQASEYLVYTEAYSIIQETPLFSGIPVKIDEGIVNYISNQEVITLTKSTKVRISLKNNFTSGIVIALYKSPFEQSNDPEIDNSNYLINSSMDFNGDLHFRHVPNGNYMAVIESKLFTGSTDFTVSDEKEMTIEIEVSEKPQDEKDNGS